MLVRVPVVSCIHWLHIFLTLDACARKGRSHQPHSDPVSTHKPTAFTHRYCEEGRPSCTSGRFENRAV
jgi:hypothetical protein